MDRGIETSVGVCRSILLRLLRPVALEIPIQLKVSSL